MSPTVSTNSVCDQARKTLDQLRAELLGHRTPQGHWVGELSSSALSTATAVSAISTTLIHDRDAIEDPAAMQRLVIGGMRYLMGQANPDGGFGDTDRSHSNIATSYLVLAANRLAARALHACSGTSIDEAPLQNEAPAIEQSPSIDEARLDAYLESAGRIDGLRQRYGKDKTFVIPILTNLAIAGVVSWRDVAALPFEAAALPQSFYRFVRMPVVSYAVPALVAIGQVKHLKQPTWFLPLRLLRTRLIPRTLSVLRAMQPESGGYLEATPLTSFVLMSLAASGQAGGGSTEKRSVARQVSRDAMKFLVDSVRDDGSFPIDTNLATWVTSLSIEALSADPEDDGDWITDDLRRWHADCQTKVRHPFTGANPGGWGWTDLTGAVPDGDDTPAAMLATAMLYRDGMVSSAGAGDAANRVALGADWLAGLQNRDGGFPTFCRGWGRLPFDRSSVDLTAHAIRALGETSRPHEGSKAHRAAVGFLIRSQESDGSWLPLWFGNQDRIEEDNPVYGTSRVLMAARWLPDEVIVRGVDYLVNHQNSDGGWGGGRSVAEYFSTSNRSFAERAGDGHGSKRDSKGDHDSIGDHDFKGEKGSNRDQASNRDIERLSCVEETALAVEGLVVARAALSRSQGQTGGELSESPPHDDSPATKRHQAAILSGVQNLIESVSLGRHHTAWPIGFYFAKLWYYEKLYPLIYTVRALGHFLSQRRF